MPKLIDIQVPDIGDFNDIPIIEILVKSGQAVNKEDSLLTLESDKATLEVPAPENGVIAEILVNIGDKVSTGSLIARMQPQESATVAKKQSNPQQKSQTVVSQNNNDKTELVVIGAGPGGYTAAFRAADLGLNVTLIERYPTLGGVCLNVGCIPSKALLHTGKIIHDAKQMASHGVDFGNPKIDIKKLSNWKSSVVNQLTKGLATMAKQRKVNVIQGSAKFIDANHLSITKENETKTLAFEKTIIAAGSQAVKLPGLPWEDARLMDSTDALDLNDIPKKLLVIGGGIIGLEMASVYHALGSKITVVELANQLMPGADPDLVRPFQKYATNDYEAVLLNTKVSNIKAQKNGLKVDFEGKENTSELFDKVLVAVGRTPNGHAIDAGKAGVNIDAKGFILVDKQMRTNIDHIFAIGDIVGQPMLAHKATHEGKVAAEVCAGKKSEFVARVIPSVAYTDPEVAWVGLTETQAKQDNIDYQVSKFPWAASGRALGQARTEGVTKLLFDPTTERLLGAGIVGPHAGDLIAEAALAIEMGCDAHDIGLTIHPHPTLSETIVMAAEAFTGTITDLYIPRKK